MIAYKRTTPELSPWDVMCPSKDGAHSVTQGIVHMLLPDKYLTLDEIMAEITAYNSDCGPYEGEFESDPLTVAQYLAVLAAVGMVAVEVK